MKQCGDFLWNVLMHNFKMQKSTIKVAMENERTGRTKKLTLRQNWVIVVHIKPHEGKLVK